MSRPRHSKDASDDDWSSPTLSENPAPPVPAPPVSPPPAEQTVRRSDLARQAPPAPSVQPVQPVQPPPAEQTVRRADLFGPATPAPTPAPPPAQQTVQRTSLGAFVAPAPPVASGGHQIVLDPAALARKMTMRSGRASMVVDDAGLTIRALLRKKVVSWSEIAGFEVRYDDPADPMSGGRLAALTTSGPLELPATRRAGLDLGYTQALLEAYRVRSHSPRR